MPLTRYRSVVDMPDVAWRQPGDPELYLALRALWTTSRRLAPRQFPAGVYRHRSMDSMNQQRDEWDADFVAALRRSRDPQQNG